MQPNIYFIIFQEKYQRNSAQIFFSELGRFRPGPFGRTALPPGLQAQKPGPGPGRWRSRAGLLGPWSGRPPWAVGFWSDGSHCSWPDQNPALSRLPQNPNFISFSSPSLLSRWRRQASGRRRHRRRGPWQRMWRRRRALLGGGARGCSENGLSCYISI